MRRIFVFLWNLTFSTRWMILINLVFAAIVGYNGMQFILLFKTSFSVPYLPSLNHSLSEIKPTVTTSLSILPLTELHLFGQPREQEASSASPLPSLPPVTPINLKLHGIYYSSHPEASYAIMTTPDEKSAKYKRGETLAEGVKLDTIEPKKVILMRNNRKEIMYLEGIQPVSQTSLSGKNEPSSPSVRPERLLGDYQRQLRGDPMRLMKLIHVYPVSQGGNFLGYRLSPGQDPTFTSQFKSQFNLQMGDIITTINGIKLDSPLKGLTIIEQLATADHLDLSILRDGQMMSLSFAIEK